MKSKEYWARRYLLDKAGHVNTGEDFLKDTIEPLYQEALKEIEQDIEKFYRTFADQENISLAEAKKQLRRLDFEKINFEGLARQQAAKQKEYAGLLDQLPGGVVAAMEKEHEVYERLLAAYTKKGSISRLEQLQVEIEKSLYELYDKNQMQIYDFLQEQYVDSYYKSVFKGQQAIGFGKDFVAPNQRAIEQAVLHNYKKDNYDKLLWGHRKNLAKDLRENLTVGLIKGESLSKMATRIKRRMEVSRSNAYRLVRTESAYIYEQATRKAYEECGIEKYEFLATLDMRTSEICQELDGKVFHLKDARPGKNYPPMHPNCRSTTVAAFEDDVVTARLAKDEDGGYYEVPSNMTFQQWYKKYAHLEANKDKRIKSYINSVIDNITDLKEPIKLKYIQYNRTFEKLVKDTPNASARMLEKFYDEINIINTNPVQQAYIPRKKGIRVLMNEMKDDKRGQFTGLLHEIGHNIDGLLGWPSKKCGMREALRDDADRLFTSLIVSGKCDNVKESYEYISKIVIAHKYHAVSDLLGGLTDNQCKGRYMHYNSYWRKNESRLEKEAFAHFFEASFNTEKIKLVREFFPTAYEAYEEVIKNGL